MLHMTLIDGLESCLYYIILLVDYCDVFKSAGGTHSLQRIHAKFPIICSGELIYILKDLRVRQLSSNVHLIPLTTILSGFAVPTLSPLSIQTES